MIAIKDFEMPKNCGDCYLTSIKSVSNPWDMICSCNLKDININAQTIAEHCPLVEAIPIPKDATNGDILRTIFPKAKHELQKFFEEDTIVFDLDGFYMRISSDWWNSPYKENIEDGKID